MEETCVCSQKLFEFVLNPPSDLGVAIKKLMIDDLRNMKAIIRIRPQYFFDQIEPAHNVLIAEGLAWYFLLKKHQIFIDFILEDIIFIFPINY